MKSRTQRGIAVAGLALLVLAGCATNRLSEYDVAGADLLVRVRVAPEAQMRAHYAVDIDPDDPVSTFISVGSSVAKAGQVHAARERMDDALRDVPMQVIMEEELTRYLDRTMDVRRDEERFRAEYLLSVRVREYGIEAAGPGPGVKFILRGDARLYADRGGGLVWENGFWMSTGLAPAVFGLPGSADNVVSAVMLSELSREEIANGIERLARDAAWQIAEEFEHDLYESRRARY